MVGSVKSPVRELQGSGVGWRKSTLSGNDGCVEVELLNGEVRVRDSKHPNGPALSFSITEWTEFIAGVRNGEFDSFHEEFEAFYAAHYKSLRLYLMGQGYRVEDADDIVQDSMLILRDRWMRVKMMKHPKAYWFRTATRLMWRLQRRRGFAVMPESDEQVPSLVYAFDGIASVDDNLTALSMIYGLPRRQQQVLWLRAVEGLPEVETADILSISVGTVKSHYHDARARLRELVEAKKPWREERL